VAVVSNWDQARLGEVRLYCVGLGEVGLVWFGLSKVRLGLVRLG
jgi:hypothetical protein